MHGVVNVRPGFFNVIITIRPYFAWAREKGEVPVLRTFGGSNS